MISKRLIMTPYKLPDEEIARALKATEGFPKP